MSETVCKLAEVHAAGPQKEKANKQDFNQNVKHATLAKSCRKSAFDAKQHFFLQCITRNK